MPDTNRSPTSPQDKWDRYYRDCQNVPWTGSKMTFLSDIWYWFNLPRQGSVLDVGCGRGDKSIFLAQTGFDVWGIDIAASAIEHAKKAALVYKTKPHFLVGNVSKISELIEISKQKFAIILDLFSTQFLSDQQRTTYLSDLQNHILPHQTFYILQCFARGDSAAQPEPSDKDKLPSLSFEEVKQSYGKYFEILYHEQTRDKLGRDLATYVLKSAA